MCVGMGVGGEGLFPSYLMYVSYPDGYYYLVNKFELLKKPKIVGEAQFNGKPRIEAAL